MFLSIINAKSTSPLAVELKKKGISDIGVLFRWIRCFWSVFVRCIVTHDMTDIVNLGRAASLASAIRIGNSTVSEVLLKNCTRV